MLKQFFYGLLVVLFAGMLTACSGTPYTPNAATADPIDMSKFAPKAKAFVVLLDTSGSMDDEYQGRPKIQTAQDAVASFNSAVPAIDLKAALGIFGRGAGTCLGYGAAETIYGLSTYNADRFASALASVECAASTTPIADAIDNTSALLRKQQGPTAVIIVSDLKWSDPDAVEAAVEQLKANRKSGVCLHIIKVGDDPMGDAVASSIAGTAGCGSVSAAGDLASGATMSAFVASTLLTPVEITYKKHTLSAVTLFDFDRYVLKPQGKAALQELAAEIRAQGMKVGDIDVVGHTDNIGTAAYNQALSERRAMAVKAYLVNVGINAGIIDAIGRGMSEPVASNDTAQGRAENRRVEISVGTTTSMR